MNPELELERVSYKTRWKNEPVLRLSTAKSILQTTVLQNQKLKQFILDIKAPTNNELAMQFCNSGADEKYTRKTISDLLKLTKEDLIRQFRLLQGYLKKKEGLLVDKVAELRIANKKLELCQSKLYYLQTIFDKRTFRYMKLKGSRSKHGKER